MKRISQKDFFSATLLATSSALCLALSAALWKYLITPNSLLITIFIRFFLPFLLVGILIITNKIKLYFNAFKSVLIRSCFVFISQYAFLFVLVHSNLLKATLLYSTSGFFLPIVMCIFLKVKPSNKAILSILLSFIGIIIALGSWDDILSSTSIVGLTSGLLTALAQMIQHRTSKRNHPMVINLFLYGICSGLALIFLSINSKFLEKTVSFFVDLSFLDFIIIFAFSVLTVSNQYMKNLAFKYVNKASSLVPFFYTTIVFSGFIDWLWLGIVPHTNKIIGSTLVIIGGVIMSLRKIKA